MKLAEYVKGLPWVRPLKKEPRVPCDGIKWSKVGLRDLYSTYGKPARGIQDKAHCKNAAKWKFTATKQRHYWERLAKSGNYCTTHLASELLQEPEIRRVERYRARQLPSL